MTLVIHRAFVDCATVPQLSRDCVPIDFLHFCKQLTQRTGDRCSEFRPYPGTTRGGRRVEADDAPLRGDSRKDIIAYPLQPRNRFRAIRVEARKSIRIN